MARKKYVRRKHGEANSIQARFLVSVRGGGGDGNLHVRLRVRPERDPFSFITNRVPDSLSMVAGET